MQGREGELRWVVTTVLQMRDAMVRARSDVGVESKQVSKVAEERRGEERRGEERTERTESAPYC